MTDIAQRLTGIGIILIGLGIPLFAIYTELKRIADALEDKNGKDRQ